MAIKKFKKTYTTNKDIDTLQSNIQVSFDQITSFEPLSGVKVEGVQVLTTGTVIDHKLGRQPIGFLITDKVSPGDVYRTAWDSRTLTLQSSANTTITLWVF